MSSWNSCRKRMCLPNHPCISNNEPRGMVWLESGPQKQRTRTMRSARSHSGDKGIAWLSWCTSWRPLAICRWWRFFSVAREPYIMTVISSNSTSGRGDVCWRWKAPGCEWPRRMFTRCSSRVSPSRRSRRDARYLRMLLMHLYLNNLDYNQSLMVCTATIKFPPHLDSTIVPFVA